MKYVWKGALLALLLIAVAGVAFWLGRDMGGPAKPPEQAAGESGDTEAAVPVETAKIQEGMLTAYEPAYGQVQPQAGSSVVVSVPFDVRISKSLVTTGSLVYPGTALFEIGPTPDAELQLKQAEDALSAATRSLQQVQRRFKEQLATNADVAAAEQAERSARAQVESLQQRGVSSTRTVAAQVSGTLSQISVQPGQTVPAGTPMAIIAPDQALEAVVGVEPSVATNLKAGEIVSLRTVFDDKAQTSETRGRIRLVGEQVNPQTRLRDVSVTPPQGAGFLPGMFVVAQVPSKKERGLLVPRSAVTLPEGSPVVFTVADGKAKKHEVSILLENEKQALVQGKDLHAGDMVVTRGGLELDDGAAVTAKGPGQGAPASGESSASADSAAPRSEAR